MTPVARAINVYSGLYGLAIAVMTRTYQLKLKHLSCLKPHGFALQNLICQCQQFLLLKACSIEKNYFTKHVPNKPKIVLFIF